MTVECSLCELKLSEEKIFYEDNSFIVLRTKTLKGHKERIMLVYKIHTHSLSMQDVDVALELLERVGRQIFKYTPKFIIMDSTFATNTEHWHLVVTDLDPKSEDFEQILNTRWLKVIDRNW